MPDLVVQFWVGDETGIYTNGCQLIQDLKSALTGQVLTPVRLVPK